MCVGSWDFVRSRPGGRMPAATRADGAATDVAAGFQPAVSPRALPGLSLFAPSGLRSVTLDGSVPAGGRSRLGILYASSKAATRGIRNGRALVQA